MFDEEGLEPVVELGGVASARREPRGEGVGPEEFRLPEVDGGVDGVGPTAKAEGEGYRAMGGVVEAVGLGEVDGDDVVEGGFGEVSAVAAEVDGEEGRGGQMGLGRAGFPIAAGGGESGDRTVVVVVVVVHCGEWMEETVGLKP